MFGLDFPNLTSGNHHISSPQEHHHNCVAYAVHLETLILWPDDDGHWPTDVTRSETLDAFVEFFVALGFESIPANAVSYQPGFEKIAIFCKGGHPLHVARQVASGRWKSKLGRLVDITHDLSSLEGGDYGYVAKIMRRHDTGKPPALPPLTPSAPLIIRP